MNFSRAFAHRLLPASFSLLPGGRFRAASKRPASFSAYRRLQRFAVGFLAVEFIVGMGGYLTARHEIFPFASWFLFAAVPGSSVDYDLVLRAADDQPIDPPLPFNQAVNYAHQPHSIIAFQVIQQLGSALETEDPRRSRAARRQVDALFRPPTRLQYEVVRVTYDPIERWETGRVQRRESLRTFTTGEP